MPDASLFDIEKHAEERPAPPRQRCTPRALYAFIRTYRAAHSGNSPTLGDLKDHFGGILAPLIALGKLRRKGLV